MVGEHQRARPSRLPTQGVIIPCPLDLVRMRLWVRSPYRLCVNVRVVDTAAKSTNSISPFGIPEAS